jgi:hypothetical protein
VKRDLLVEYCDFTLDKCVIVYIADGTALLGKRVSPGQKLSAFLDSDEGLIKY